MIARRTTAALALGAMALATFGAAAPSGAQSSTTVTFTVSGTGGLSVSTSGSATLGSGASLNLLDGGALTGQLPAVTVSDTRATLGTKSWALQVAAGGDFVNQDDTDYTIDAGNGRVFVNTLNGTANLVTGLLGGMTITPLQTDVLGTATLAQAYNLASGTTAPLLAGQGSITPSMSVTVPAGAAAGTYTGTITYTAS